MLLVVLIFLLAKSEAMHLDPTARLQTQIDVRSDATSPVQKLFELLLKQMVQQLSLLEAQVIYWNEAQNRKQFFGYSLGEVTTRSQHREAIQNYLGSRQSLGEALSILELQPLALKAYSDSTPPCSTVYVSILSQETEHLNYLILVASQEITAAEKKIALGQIEMLTALVTLTRDSQKKALENQFLETMLQFGQHQLQNPLALIRLHAETLFLGLSLPEQRGQADYIRKASDCLGEQISNLFTYSKDKQIQKSICDLRAIFDEAQALLAPKLEQKNIEVKYSALSLKLFSDQWQLAQVFENILDNAIYFTPDGGEIQVNWHLFQNEILITIADQGPGIPTRDLGKIFDGRYSYRQGGTGLGLAISQKIILAHQGNIWADNLPEGGAQFSIVLPQ